MRGHFADTNIFLRLLTGDDPVQSAAAAEFIGRVIAGEAEAYATVAVVLELVWTLESYYGLGRGEVAEKITLLLNTRRLGVENRDLVEEALEHYKSSKADFVDCYNAAFAALTGDGTVLSYDRDFDKLTGVTRLEPGPSA